MSEEEKEMATKPLIGMNADFRSAKNDAPAFSFVCPGYYDGLEDGDKINVNDALPVNRPNGFIEKEN